MNKILIGIVVVIVLIAAAAFFFVSSTEAPVALKSNAEEDQAVRNTALYASIVSGGIEDPFVNIDENQAVVMYDLPKGFDLATMQAFVIGAEASSAPDSKKFVAVVYVDGKAKAMWTVAAADFAALVEGTLTDEQYEAKIEKKDL